MGVSKDHICQHRRNCRGINSDFFPGEREGASGGQERKRPDLYSGVARKVLGAGEICRRRKGYFEDQRKKVWLARKTWVQETGF